MDFFLVQSGTNFFYFPSIMSEENAILSFPCIAVPLGLLQEEKLQPTLLLTMPLLLKSHPSTFSKLQSAFGLEKERYASRYPKIAPSGWFWTFAGPFLRSFCPLWPFILTNLSLSWPFVYVILPKRAKSVPK